MKKIIFLVLIIILLLALCSCSMMNIENQIESTRFIRIESCELGAIVVDSETNVEYWISEGAYNHGTLTMLVNEDGSPKIRKYEH